MENISNSITPCLWFDSNAKEAALFYIEVFKNGKITSETPMMVTFELNGNSYMGLNGGANFKFSEAVSFVVTCKTQDEIDYYWSRLTAEGGQESHCGWLKDKFGVSWQIIPEILPNLLDDPEKASRVLATYRGTKKFNIERLENA
ncbi:MAG: VOC family protein [Bacteroidota bacterium]